MHEVGIARNVIQAALEAVPDGGTLTGVTVSIGPFSAVVADSLRFGFEIASQGGPAEGVELDIVETPLVVRCDACDADLPVDDPTLLRCPRCGGTVTIVSGDETLVTAVRYDES
jgi:hydrogenase nickel incorporation protein HypA/HybF